MASPSTNAPGAGSRRRRLWRADFPFDPARFRPCFFGWVVVFASTVGTLFSIPGQTMGFSVFTELLIPELGLSRVSLSSAYFLGTISSGFTLPALGRLLDHWGARRTVVASALSTGLVLYYLSACVPVSRWLAAVIPGLAPATAAFLVMALGFFLVRLSAQGVLTMTCRYVIGKWFDYRRGLALAISGVAVTFGFSAAPRFLDVLIDSFGFRGAWFVLGCLTLGIMVPLGWLLFRDNPEESSLEMDGGFVPKARSRNPDMHVHRDMDRAEVVRTAAFWIFNLSFAFYALFGTAFTFHIVSLGREFGFSKDFIITLFMPMAAVGVATNLAFGLVNPHVRLKHLLLIMNVGAVIGALGLLRLDGPGGVVAYVIGNGVAQGGFVSLAGIVWPRFFGRRALGAISGLHMSAMVIASAIGPLLFGGSAQLTGSYGPVLMLCLGIPAVLAMASLWADNPQRKLAGQEDADRGAA